MVLDLQNVINSIVNGLSYSTNKPVVVFMTDQNKEPYLKRIIEDLQWRFKNRLIIFENVKTLKEINDKLRDLIEKYKYPDLFPEKIIFTDLEAIVKEEKENTLDIAFKLKKIYTFYGIPFEVFGVNLNNDPDYSSNGIMRMYHV